MRKKNKTTFLNQPEMIRKEFKKLPQWQRNILKTYGPPLSWIESTPDITTINSSASSDYSNINNVLPFKTSEEISSRP